MKKLSSLVLVAGSLILAACSNGSSSTPVAAAACAQNPYGTQYPYGTTGATNCAALPYGSTAGTYGSAYGSNPCAVYNNGYQTWTVGYYGGSAVCVSNY